MHLTSEREGSTYNFEYAQVDFHRAAFDAYEKESQRLIEVGVLLPAYEQLLKCSHTFNLLDARGAISQSDRPGFVLRIRTLAKRCAELYLSKLEVREAVDTVAPEIIAGARKKGLLE
jgi:glycyl-tRNA synthetase alpha chain